MAGIFLAVLLAVIPATLGFSTGAGDGACQTMTPQHYGTNPQSRTSPFRVTVSRNTFSPGTQIQVTISGCNNEVFKGFLIQARRAESSADREAQIGTFNTPDKSRVLAGCGSDGQALTHDGNVDKRSMTFTWTAPPQSPGPIVFTATVVQNAATYWVKLFSEVILETNSGTPGNLAANYPTISECSPTTTTTPRTTPTKPPTIITATMQTDKTTPRKITIPGFSYDEECGYTKGCLATCTNMACSNLVSYSTVGSEVLFELTSVVKNNGNQWMAIGFSDDKMMGNDSVAECVSYYGEYKVYSSFNRPAIKYNERLPGAVGVRLVSASLSGNIFRCSFFREMHGRTDDYRFFDIGKKHHLFFASGPTDDSSNKKMMHVPLPKISNRVDLGRPDRLAWPAVAGASALGIIPSKAPVGGIAGGVGSAVVLISVIVVTIVVVRRRRMADPGKTDVKARNTTNLADVHTDGKHVTSTEGQVYEKMSMQPEYVNSGMDQPYATMQSSTDSLALKRLQGASTAKGLESPDDEIPTSDKNYADVNNSGGYYITVIG